MPPGSQAFSGGFAGKTGGILGDGGGGAFKVINWYHLRWGKRYKRLNWYAYPAGAYFCSYKSRQNTLGALPQDPCRWLRWIRIDFRREPEINPYCAQNRSQGSRSASALSPHPLSRCGKGARMGGRLKTESDVLGVLGLVGSQVADLKVFVYLPHSSPPPRRGQGWWFAVLRSSAAAIKMRRRLFLSPSACSTDLDFS